MASAAVVGSGPNGLAAAVVLARAGVEVTVYEAQPAIGGGAGSAFLLSDDAVTDTCSAVHPFAVGSPVFEALELERRGLEWIHPDIPLAHPLDHRPAAVLHRSAAATASGLGGDGSRYRRLVDPVVESWPTLMREVLGPPLHVPRAPLPLVRFGLRALWPSAMLARAVFRDEPARALFAGLAAHSLMPQSKPLTSSFGVLFGAAAHAVGWPVARGGSLAIAKALAADLEAHGGRIVCDRRIESLDELRGNDLLMLDVAPSGFLRMAGHRLPDRYARGLRRFRHGAAAYKVDYLLDGEVPWTDPACRRAGTVHLGGTLDEVAAAEADAAAGRVPERPFVLVAQQSLFDPSRVPAGRQVLWAYAHVPHGCTVPMGELIDRQIERFAPGFRDRIVGRHEESPAELERRNPNYVGGDIAGGAVDGLQIVFRPTARIPSYATPLPGVYLCSASTPPGGGVHGMCGYRAARTALRKLGWEDRVLRLGTGSPAASSIAA